MKELVIRVKIKEGDPVPETPEAVVDLMWEVNYIDGGGVVHKHKVVGCWEVRDEPA